MTNAICQEPECQRVVNARGLCGAHWIYRYRHGIPFPALAPKPTTEERLARYSIRQGDCLLWTGAISKGGYGVISVRIDGRKHVMSAHRLAYELAHGSIPDGLFACHTCDHRNCINPDHIWLGTHSDNMQDMVAKGRHGRTRAAGMSVPAS